MNLIDFVVQELTKLPGLGRKSAARITYHLLKSDEARVETLVEAIRNLKKKIRSPYMVMSWAELQPELVSMIEADKAGTIKSVLIENGQPVEYNQPLFIIE